MRANSTKRKTQSNFKLFVVLFVSVSVVFIFLCQLKQKQPYYSAAEAPNPVFKWAGVRSSRYAIKPFPSEIGWSNSVLVMSNYFPGSQPTIIWLAGEILFQGKQSGQGFNFPNPEGTWDSTIQFNTTDENESYLNYFDSQGIKVFLQVEPGYSNMDQLFDIMYQKYSHHPSLIGFGVDVEWYKSSCNGCPNAKVTDSLAQGWEAKVKSLNPNYFLFLKHFNREFLPQNYRGDIIFIDDSEQNGSLDKLLTNMKSFSDFFYPNPVMFQIGYPSDRFWWNNLAKPTPQTIGNALLKQTKSGQSAGVIWVDFSLRDLSAY